MQVLVKNGDRLYSLGEGKIYSKKQVKLKEGLDASIGTANGLQQAQMKAKNAMAQPNVTSASGDLGKMDGQNDSNTGEGGKDTITSKCVYTAAKQCTIYGEEFCQ